MAEKNKNNNSLVFADNGYLSYIDFSKLSFADKLRRRLNIAKAQFDNGSLAKAGYALVGGYDPENPRLSTGDVPNPGMRNPAEIVNNALLSIKLMETINNYWKNLGRLKIRLGGNGKYASGILTKPGTAPTTFNGLNISYITSPKGGKVTHKFYTDLGSEYILTKDGFARRIKSPHSNVEGSDSGLHDWNEGTTIFTKGEDGKLFNTAFYKFSDFGFKPGTYGLVRQNGKAKIMLIDPKTKLWREAMFSDAYPTSVKLGLLLDRVLSVDYSDVPFVGGHILEKTSGSWHPGSSVAFIEGLKQGGKMNILEFLKNGSGIHIKEKNKGKFTSYCGGKVTDECILKGKNSSNPAIRKRATFAANARKWKHLDGGIIIAEKGIKAGLKAKQNLTKRKAPDWDNLDRGYRYLTQDMKLPHDLAIAIMGNVVEESQGNYKAALKNGGGRGLIQWDGQPTPTGRYGLWGKIWASVAKPANVYDSKTDTMKNYWAPWGGLKGELVRLKFINAPLKTKTKIYAESYLRPGNPRIKDRQLSAMLLDSIYNPRIKNIIIDKEGGIIKAEDGTKFNWQSALTNIGTNLFNSYLQSRIQNNKINSEAEAAKAENEVDLNQYFLDIYLQELAKALLEEELKNKAISAMNDTVINSSPLVTLKIAYDKASKSYGNLKANLDARNKAIDAQAEAAKSSVITDAVSGVIQNGLGMLKDYYGSKNNNTSTSNSTTGNSNSYFDNYVNTKYKKFGTFNPDGSMNMFGGTFTINGGYKPNQPQLFNYQPLKLNV